MRTAATALIALILAALAGCQAPDVGAQCQFGVPLPSTLAVDYVETGNTECDNLVCIASPIPTGSKVKWNPYCSKPCVGDSDCSPSDTGLSCRKVVLDDAFLATLSPDVKQKYLGNTSAFSQYCAAPLPQ
jgi:hypothetical protein